METYTVGRIIYKDYNLKLKYVDNEMFSDEMKAYNCYKIIFIEKGSGIVSINENKYIFTAPALFCIRNDETVSIVKGIDITARSLYFLPVILNKAFTFDNVFERAGGLKDADYQDAYWLRVFTVRTQDYTGILSVCPSLIQRIINLFNSINAELQEQRDTDWPCRSRSFLFELLFLLQQYFSLMKHQEATLILPDKITDIDSIILYLHMNYRQKITISELSKMFNINRTTLEKKFAEITGLSIISYLIRLRMELSLKLLKGTLLPVSEIMDRTGFNDRTYFNRNFKKYTGYSPSEYRQEFCWLLQRNEKCI